MDGLPDYDVPDGTQAVSPQAAYIVTDILAGNTDPAVNPVWGTMELTSASGRRRPAALKTGTNNDAKDLSAYGFIAPPTAAGRKQGEYALALGVWMGNSDSSPVGSAADPVFSLDTAAPLWQAVMDEVTRDWRVNDFQRPGGLVNASVDAYTGYKPSNYSRQQVQDVFIKGTTPGDDPYVQGLDVMVGTDGKTYRWAAGCSGEKVRKGYLVLNDADAGQPTWQQANKGWIARARRGPGVQGGPKDTATAYFYEPTFQPYGQELGRAVPAGTDLRRRRPARHPVLVPPSRPAPRPARRPPTAPTEVPTEVPTSGPPRVRRPRPGRPTCRRPDRPTSRRPNRHPSRW